jgi:hypothetical protein
MVGGVAAAPLLSFRAPSYAGLPLRRGVLFNNPGDADPACLLATLLCCLWQRLLSNHLSKSAA